MNEEKLEYLVEVANKLISAMRLETDFDTEDAFWEFEKEHIRWIRAEDLIRLSSLANEFSNRCEDLATAL